MMNKNFSIGDFLQYTFYGSRYVFKASGFDQRYNHNSNISNDSNDSNDSNEYYNIVLTGEWNYYDDEPEYYIVEYCEYWTPIKDEWCWFWDEGQIPQPRKFDKIESNGHFLPLNAVRGFKYCEPMMGALPSCLEDVENEV